MDDEMGNKLKQTVTKDGAFSVRLMYKALKPRSTESSPWLIVWKSCVQQKICFLTKEAVSGKILTLDQLQKKGFALANKCYLGHEEETIDHLLLHCVKTRLLWELLFPLLEVTWINPSSIWDTLLSQKDL